MADLDDIVAILEQIRDDTVPGLASSINDLAEATNTATSASEDAADAARELSGGLKETGDAAKKSKKHLADWTMGLDTMAKGIKKTTNGFGGIISGFREVGGGAFSAAQDIKKNSDALVGMIQETRRTTGMSKEMAFQIADTADALRIYGVTSDDASAAVNTLYNSTSVYSQLSSEMQANLANEGALMAQLGFSMSDYAQGIEVSMKSMGMSSDEAADNMRQLRATAIDLNMPISTLTSNFSANANMLAKLGDNGMKAFSELTRITKVTGLEMSKLLGITDKFDTFEGAADAVGGLNAALGGNFVDSMSLMMETDPAERFKMIRGAIDDAGMAFQDMEYYQKKMIAESAGFGDVADFAKAMSGDINALVGDMGKTDSSAEAAMTAAATLRTPEEMAANFARALEPAAGAIAKTMVKASDDFGKAMLPTIQALDNSTKAMTANLIMKDDNNIIGQMAVLMGYLAVIGPKIGGVTAYFSGFGTIASGALSVVSGIFTTIIGALTSFPALVAAVLFTLTSAFVGLYKKSEDIMALFDAGEFGMAVSMAVGAMITGIIAAVGKLAAMLADALGFEAPWITKFLDAFSPETFDQIMLDIGTAIFDGFESIINFDWAALDAAFFVAFTDAAEAGIRAFKDFFQISSPSKLMMDMIGGPILDGIMAPFSDFPKMLKDLMQSALESIPGPIRSIIEGAAAGESVFDTAGKLANVATDAAAANFEALKSTLEIGGENKEPYQLNLSMNMDGREIDKKVVNVIGGVARDATR